MKNNTIDLANYIGGFNVEVNGREIKIYSSDVREAIDGISFKLLPMNLLPFIPATISPCKASEFEDYLEHPTKAFEEYKKMGAKKLIGELKHMGSRAVILAFESEEKALQYTNQTKTTIIYSRNGLSFFKGEDELYISNKIQKLLKENNYFEKHHTGFVLMDVEILPWNAKGSGLLTNQYLPVLDGNKSLNSKLLENLQGVDGVETLTSSIKINLENVEKYKEQLESYCWDSNVETIQIAPFHLLAHEGQTYFDQTHEFHLTHFHDLINMEENDLFVKTPYVLVDLESEESMKEAVDFWIDVTNKGYEGVMFKTETFIEKNKEGETILPMMKIRGKDYLRLIYGINYDSTEYLPVLRNRNISKKRFLHYRQTELSIESVKRFAKGEPFENWHDYILANLCLGNVVTDHRL